MNVTDAIQQLTKKDAETIRDALCLSELLIHDQKLIEVKPFEETLSKERIERVLALITYQNKTRRVLQ
jgi:hypothetical protein